MTKLIKKLWRGRRAASLVEFAIVLPLLMVMAGGLWEFGHIYDATLVATNAAREGARWAALGYDDASVQDRVLAYLDAAGYGQRTASGELQLNVAPCPAPELPDPACIYLLDDPIDVTNPPGSPGAPVQVVLPVRVTIYFPGILSLAGTLDIMGEATMRLETVAGSGSLPPPAMGTATPTPTPTPTPICPTVSISGVSFTPVGNSGKVNVSWTTNVDADSRIEWGITPSYGSSASSGSRVTSHALQMTGIDAGTLYYYAISSTSSCGQSATSAGTYTR